MKTAPVWSKSGRQAPSPGVVADFRGEGGVAIAGVFQVAPVEKLMFLPRVVLLLQASLRSLFAAPG
jgi:hypothetical protein